jgi:hypothetical protein
MNVLLLVLIYVVCIGVPAGLCYWAGYHHGRSTCGERPEQAQGNPKAEVAKQK